MKRVRRKVDDTTAEESTPAAVARPERKSGLLRECWADLRGRPRPVAEPEWEQELQPVHDTGGIGLDDDGMRRMQTRYGASTN